MRVKPAMTLIVPWMVLPVLYVVLNRTGMVGWSDLERRGLILLLSSVPNQKWFSWTALLGKCIDFFPCFTQGPGWEGDYLNWDFCHFQSNIYIYILVICLDFGGLTFFRWGNAVFKNPTLGKNDIKESTWKPAGIWLSAKEATMGHPRSLRKVKRHHLPHTGKRKPKMQVLSNEAIMR